MKKKMKKTSQVFLNGALILALVLAMSGVYMIPKASAAALTSKSDIMTRLQVSTASDHTIEFTTPTGVAADGTITVTFPAGFDTASIVFGDVDLEDDSVDVTLAGTPSGTTWGAVMSSDVLTFTNGSTVVAAGSVITIEIGTNATSGTNQIINDSSTGDATIAIAGTFGDTGDILVELLTDDTVHITATVDESLNFSISDIDVGFGDLTSANARYANAAATGSDSVVSAHDLVAGTNATGGYAMTVQGATLTSGSDTIDMMGTEVVSSAGTEQFGIRMTSSGGSGTVNTNYDDTAANTYYYGATASTTDDVASAAGATADTTYSVYYLANIASNTEAGLYETDLTYITTATY